jgi:catechol 2,3-dioxygenase-like lactoylglutathione lyase family enzyme
MIRIRQVALCTDDVWREEQEIVSTLGVAGVHRDPPNVFEMCNVVFAVGDTFLEVLQPTADSAPSATFLSKRGGPGGYMLILQVDDLDAARARVDALGIRIAYDEPPASHHGVEAAAIHLHPADTGGAIISLDRMDPVDGWAWAGRAWRGHVHTNVVERIVGVELRSSDVEAVATRFATLVDRPCSIGDAGEWTIGLEDSIVRVVEGPSGERDQLTAVEMLATDRSTVGAVYVIAGTEIRLV